MECRKDNIKDIGGGLIAEEVTDYATSRADIIIRQDMLFNLPMQCCMVSLIEDVPSVDTVMRLVGEMKVDDSIDNDLPETECFHNMSAVAASLAMEVLAQDLLVNQVKIYGIVIRITNLDHTRLLRLDCNYVEGNCTFLKCRKVLP